jgi:DNA-binding FadR family transcriptional regulator
VPIEAIEPRRLYRQVADQLRQLIEAGEFRAGERLPPERELAVKLGISRPTVREALIALEVEGRVRIRVGSGIYVTAPPAAAADTGTSGASAATSGPAAAAARPGSPAMAAADPTAAGAGPAARPAPPAEGPFELLRARALIEGAVAAEAALHAGAADLARLDDVLARMTRAPHPSAATIALDREFHTGVAAILGNAVVVRFVGELFDERVNPYFERLSSYFENAGTWRLAVEEHRAVRDAIAAHDPDAARAAMHTHLRRSQARFSPSFGRAAAERPAAVDEEDLGRSEGPPGASKIDRATIATAKTGRRKT